MIGLTTSADVAGTGALTFAFGMPVWLWARSVMERISPSLRTPWYRIWSRGIAGVCAVGGLVALVVAGWMWAAGATFQ
jgi:hypothetical protein